MLSLQTVALLVQACALGALVWLPPPTGIYLQVAAVVAQGAVVVIRYRAGMRDYRRLNARSREHEAEFQRLSGQ